MSLFHRHHWVVTSQRFTAPRIDEVDLHGKGPNLGRTIQFTLFGFTATALRCVKCGEMMTRCDIGDVRSDSAAP